MLVDCDRLLDAYETEWNGPSPPSLSSYVKTLRSLETQPDEFVDAAISLAKIDMEFRWMYQQARRSDASELLHAEDYAKFIPEFRDETPDQLIQWEYWLQRRFNQVRSPDLIRKRFPHRVLDDELFDWVEDEEYSRTERRLISCPNCGVSCQTPSGMALCEHCGKEFMVAGEPVGLKLEKIDHYEIREKLGTGSFGTVWRAYDRQLNRVVAIKLPRASDWDGGQRKRFQQEAQAAAELQHPNIVSVFDVGSFDETPYIVSELVDGQPLSKIINEPTLSIRQKVGIVRKVALALECAHRRGVVHRDIKPANILIDKNVEPHIVDFGLAKRSVADVTISADGKFIGTPSYCSPEQARSESSSVDHRSDIYSLGVVLFELLTGELPFRGNHWGSVLNQVVHDQPVRPRHLNNQVPKDLDTICLKCLEKRKQDRFSTAGQLAQELERFLEGRPVLSRPLGIAARTWRYCRRKPFVAATVTLLVLVSIASPLLLVREIWLRRIVTESLYDSLFDRVRAEVAAQQPGFRGRVFDSGRQAAALGVERDSDELRQLIVNAMGSPLGWEPQGIRLEGRVCASTFDQLGNRLAVAFVDGRIQILDPHTGSVRRAYSIPEGDRIAAIYVDRVGITCLDAAGRFFRWSFDSQPTNVGTIPIEDGVHGAHFDRSGDFVAVQNMQWVEVWDVNNFARLDRYYPDWSEVLDDAASEQLRGIVGVRVDVEEQLLTANYFAALPDRSGFFCWQTTDPASCRAVAVSSRPTYPNSIDISANGREISFGAEAIYQYDVETLSKVRSTLPGGELHAVRYSSCGRFVAGYWGSGRIQVFSARGNQTIASFAQASGGEARGIRNMHFSSDNSMLLATRANMLTTWNADAGPERLRIAQHSDETHGLAFSHNGKLLASGGYDRQIVISDGDTGRILKTLTTEGPVQYLVFSPDDRWLISAEWGAASQLVLWSTADWKSMPISHQLGEITAVAFNESGTKLAGTGNGLQMWNVVPPENQTFPTLSSPKSWDGARSLTIASAGRFGSPRLAWINNDTDIIVGSWENPTARTLKSATGEVAWHGLSFVSEEHLAFFSRNRLVIWDTKLYHATPMGGSPTLASPCIAVADDGRYFAGLSTTKSVCIWDLKQGRRIVQLPAEGFDVTSLSWRPNGHDLAVGTVGGDVSIWRIDKLLEELASIGVASTKATSK